MLSRRLCCNNSPVKKCRQMGWGVRRYDRGAEEGAAFPSSLVLGLGPAAWPTAPPPARCLFAAEAAREVVGPPRRPDEWKSGDGARDMRKGMEGQQTPQDRQTPPPPAPSPRPSGGGPAAAPPPAASFLFRGEGRSGTAHRRCPG
eukprot:TRINITY_DN16078_c0_g1_i1.p3 TRINITY_DN16078_c0_g1~~TRINITY_DN16078_c0_g1_i1.p3  ORF type:complete len:145 (-),score=1.99 TRINITY_DN16078_c0_g1_i1:531-965(-)